MASLQAIVDTQTNDLSICIQVHFHKNSISDMHERWLRVIYLDSVGTSYQIIIPFVAAC